MRCRGLTAVTREKYFPNYKFVPGSGAWAGGAIKKKRDGGGGVSRGRRVDVEVERWIKSRVRAATATTATTTTTATTRGSIIAPFSTRAFVAASSAASAAASAAGATNARARVGSVDGSVVDPTHPLARAFVALTHRLRLVPVGAQVVVRDEQCDLATLVDGVFVNERGRVVLVELKCGFEGYNDTSNGRMRHPFRAFTNAPKNQHQIQLAFTRCMFERTFPEFGRVDARIVRMTERGAHVTTIDDDLDATARRVFAAGRRV